MTTATKQQTFDDLGLTLAQATFVVFDLETTGGSATKSHITEIGAVKIRGGEVLGEFQTLVNPRVPIPPSITLLTGITDSMVVSAPGIEAVLPAFTEFIRGAILVAHNAPFDMGFLRAALVSHDYPPVRAQVIDTVRLARTLVTRDEVPNHKLATLARYFRVPTPPNHRALDDAKATVTVLNALFERAGSLGVTHVADLPQLIAPVPAARRRKVHLARGLPHSPGVYVFKDAQGRALYVGKSNNIYRRVKTYFTGAETRKRINEMVQIAHEVTPIACATELEAEIRELRLITELQPPYNRRSRRAEQAPWIKITHEPFPRLSVVRKIPANNPPAALHIGPFSSSKQAYLAVEALHETFAIRQCGGRLPRTPRADASACVLLEMGKCHAPCIGAQSVDEYQQIVDDLKNAVTTDPGAIVARLQRRMAQFAAAQRYEEARDVRNRLGAVLNGIQRSQSLAPLAACPEILAARRSKQGGWQIVLVRYGKLAGSARTMRGEDPRPAAAALQETGSVFDPRPVPAPAGTPQEAEMILKWIEQPGTRLIHVEGSWHSPIRGANRYRDLTTALQPANRHDERYERT
ncbi:MAG TPA: DEDD exonuclease domain-containing protein [Actinomycetales bacterium]|nr:DEDD exonuclease domain-containing protein [Actinomycetales bacterium]